MSVMVSLQRECLQVVKRVETSNMTIQTQQRSILKELKELEELVREGQIKPFTLKGSDMRQVILGCNKQQELQ